MTIRVYNTLTKQKEEFVPVKLIFMSAVLRLITIRILVMRVHL